MNTYMKDESGFCYAWTEALSKMAGMTPYDGEVNEGGFATDNAAPVKPTKPTKAAKVKEPEAPVVEPVDQLDAALAASAMDD